jgi:hypothetical protein
MANSQPIRSTAVVDLEKGENGGDSSSTLTGSSSTQQNEDHDTEPHDFPVAAKEDIGTYSNILKEVQTADDEVARTSTRTSWRDAAARVVTRISTKGSWKDPGPPPDGGLSGWTQVVMGHLVILNTW